MVMGSSVPSEAAFSDSGQFVRPDRGILSDAKIDNDEIAVVESVSGYCPCTMVYT
jgi:hypothetical protein